MAAELDRRARVAELDAYLLELEASLGPTSQEERAEAESWVERVVGPRRGERVGRVVKGC